MGNTSVGSQALAIYSNSILALGIISVAYAFFSLYSLVPLSEYEAWLIFIFALSPYLSPMLLKVFTGYLSNKTIGAVFISTVISFFGFYWYWSALSTTSGEKTGIFFVFTPICQWLLVLCFSVLSWFLNIQGKLKRQKS